MRGRVIAYDASVQAGAIDGEDGRRYAFSIADWRALDNPGDGIAVDFIPDGERAKAVNLVPGGAPSQPAPAQAVPVFGQQASAAPQAGPSQNAGYGNAGYGQSAPPPNAGYGSMSIPVPPAPPFSFGWLYFSLTGRATRYQYWVQYFLFYVVVEVVLGGIIAATSVPGDEGQIVPSGIGIVASLVLSLFSLVMIWPSIAVSVKRCHDRNRSGWFIFAALIPVVGWLWVLIELGFLRGTRGPNRFGPDPLPPGL